MTLADPEFWILVAGVTAQTAVVCAMLRSIRESRKQHAQLLQEMRRDRKSAVQPKLVFDVSTRWTGEGYSILPELARNIDPLAAIRLKERLPVGARIWDLKEPYGVVRNVGPGAAINAWVAYLAQRIACSDTCSEASQEQMRLFAADCVLNRGLLRPGCLRAGETGEVRHLPAALHVHPGGNVRQVTTVACIVCSDVHGRMHYTFQELYFLVRWEQLEGITVPIYWISAGAEEDAKRVLQHYGLFSTEDLLKVMRDEPCERKGDNDGQGYGADDAATHT